MTAKQFWGCTALGTFGSLIVIGTIAVLVPHSPRHVATSVSAPVVLSSLPLPAPTSDLPVAIAVQKAKLKLSDGRTATFTFSSSNGSLTCAAAIGLDEILGYALAPVRDPALPDPAPLPRQDRRRSRCRIPRPPYQPRRRATCGCCSPTIP